MSHTQKISVPMFLAWYYLEAPAAIIRGAVSYVTSIGEIFPFGFLLMTLLSPWKNIVDRTVIRGLNLNAIAEKWSLGLLACGCGLVIRLITIAFGLIVEAAFIALSLIVLGVWLTFPMLVVLGIVFSIRTL